MKRNAVKAIVCSLLIVALLAAPLSAFASSTAYIFKVAAKDAPGVYLRSSTNAQNLNPSKDNVVALLKNGTKVLYWGSSIGQMLKVMTVTGKTGYIYKGSLKRYGAMSTKQLYVVANSAPFYKRSGSSLRKAGSVKKGTPVVVYRRSNGWAYVRNVNGKKGYMKTSALKKIG